MYIGIDLGGTNIAIGIVQNDKIIKKGSIKTNSNRPVTEIIADMAKLVQELVDDVGASMDQIEAVGVGSPGIANIRDGILSNVVNISPAPIPIREELSKYLNKDIYVENDARCACLGEFIAGAAQDAKNVIMITLGTGVGGGIIIDGKIYSGSGYAAGEIGHSVICVDGVHCKCGRDGCFEQYASVSALIRMTNEKIMQHPESTMALRSIEIPVDGKFVFELAKGGDVLANEVILDYVKYIGVGIANLINIFEPEIVVVGGGISAEGDYLLDPIRNYVIQNVITKEDMITQIKQAQLGNDAGIIGAAMCGKYQNLE